MWKRAGKRLSLIRGRGHDGRIREVLQEDSRSSMYRIYDDIAYAKKKKGTKMSCVACIILLMLDYNIHDCSLFIFFIPSLLIVYFSTG
jgi:hypothetical protein